MPELRDSRVPGKGLYGNTPKCVYGARVKSFSEALRLALVAGWVFWYLK